MAKTPINNASLAGVEALPSGGIEYGWDAARQRLVVFIDCSPAAQAAASASTTGKTRLLATTRGFTRVAAPVEGLKVSLHVTLPDPFMEGAKHAVLSSDYEKLRNRLLANKRQTTRK